MKFLFVNLDQPVPEGETNLIWFGAWLVKDDGSRSKPTAAAVTDFVGIEGEPWWLCTTNRNETFISLCDGKHEGKWMLVGPDNALDMTEAEREQMFAELLAECASIGRGAKIVLSVLPFITGTLELVDDSVVTADESATPAPTVAQPL